MENILFQDSLGSGLQPSHRISLGAGLGFGMGTWTGDGWLAITSCQKLTVAPCPQLDL